MKKVFFTTLIIFSAQQFTMAERIIKMYKGNENSKYSLYTTSTEVPKAVEEILKKMDDADLKISDVSFSFKQEILITLTQEKSNITGNAIFKKPDLFKIEHSKPEKQIVVSDGKKIFFYQKEFNQVMIDDWKSLSAKGSFPKGIFNFFNSSSL